MIVALAIGAALLTATPQTVQNPEEQAQQLIARTRTTQATYALVSTNVIHLNEETIYEFAAEYNQGDLHRVETPRDRIVVNCRTGWAAHLNVATGVISHEDGIPSMACGIFTDDGLRKSEVRGSRESEFGHVQQLSIATYSAVRTYEIALNGAIVAETIVDLAGKLQLSMKAISLSDQLPKGDLFSEESLSRSVVPDELKRKAEQPGA